MKTIISPQLQHFFKNSFVNVFGGAVASFLSFLFNFVVVKSISVANYGEYMSAMAYIAVLTTPLTIMSLVIIKKISGKTKSERVGALQDFNATLNSLIGKNILWILFALPVVWLWLQKTANFSNDLTSLIVIILLLMSVVITWLTAQISGLQKFVLLTIAGILAMSGRLLIGWGVLSIKQTLFALYFALIATQLWQIIINWCLLKKATQKKLIGQRQVALHWWHYLRRKEFLVPLVATVMTTALINLDVVVIKMFTTPDFAGEYGFYSLFAKIILYAATPLIAVAFTFFNSTENKNEKNKILWLAALLIIGFTIVMTILYAAIPELLILIVGKSQYFSLKNVLFYAAIFGGVYSLVMLFTQYLIAKNSKIIFFTLLIPIIQVTLIYFFHQNVQQVMIINIGIASLVLLIYGIKKYVAAIV